MSLRHLLPVLALLAFLLTPSAVMADIVHKKDGRTVEGKIVEDTDEHVIVQTKFGPITVPRSEVLRIEKGASPADEFKTRWEEVDRDDVLALLDLADWCEENRLTMFSKKVYRRIIQVDAENETARRALGFVLVDGAWVTKAELAEAERRRKTEERKAAVERRNEKKGSEKSQTAGSDPLAGIGDVSKELGEFLKPIETNKTADAEVAKELDDFFGQPFNVSTSEHFSLRAQMPPADVVEHLKLAERLLITSNKLFGLPVDTCFWQSKGPYLFFHVKQKGTFIDLIDWIDNNINNLDPESKKFFKDGGGMISAMPRPLSARLESGAPLGHSIAHWVGQTWIIWYSRGQARSWLTEGFAAYTSINEFTVNTTYCVSQTKYENEVEIADKDSDGAYRLVCYDIIEGATKEPHPYAELVKKTTNQLDFADLAKSWSIVDFLMREHPDKFKTYIQSLGGFKQEEDCLKKVFGWTGEEFDKNWEEYVKANYSKDPTEGQKPK
ncbi:MAG: hypothetical protein V2A76_15305 [Planctomycetota bacterium]